MVGRIAVLLSAVSLGCGAQTDGTSHDAGASRESSADATTRDAPGAMNARAVEFCGAITSCGLTLAPDEMTDCIGILASDEVQGFGYGTSFISCVLASNQTCEAIKLCANEGHTFDACSLPSKVGCLGNIQEGCDLQNDSGTTWALDCSSIGATCSVQGGGCNYGPCSGAPYPYSCAGTTLRSCDPEGPDAAAYLHFNDECTTGTTATCGPGPDGGATCIGKGPACTKDRCEGTTWVSCQGGHEAPYDCGSVGLLCIDRGTDGGVTNPGVYCALAENCQSVPRDVCDGNILHFCNAGLPASLDCATSGWGHCVQLPPEVQGTGCRR
jgi:hypothetical protein